MPEQIQLKRFRCNSCNDEFSGPKNIKFCRTCGTLVEAVDTDDAESKLQKSVLQIDDSAGARYKIAGIFKSLQFAVLEARDG